MKKSLLVLAGALLCSAFMGCKSTQVAKGNESWVHNEYLAGKMATEIMGEPAIAGVGRSNLTGITGEKAARADGRVALAQRISTVVANEVANANGQNLGDEAFEQYGEATTLIANAVLSGSVQIDMKKEEETTYVLMGLPLNGLDKQLQSASMKTNNKEVRDFMNTLTVEQLQTMFK